MREEERKLSGVCVADVCRDVAYGRFWCFEFFFTFFFFLAVSLLFGEHVYSMVYTCACMGCAVYVPVGFDLC